LILFTAVYFFCIFVLYLLVLLHVTVALYNLGGGWRVRPKHNMTTVEGLQLHFLNDNMLAGLLLSVI